MASRYTSTLEHAITEMHAQHEIWVHSGETWSLRELFSTADLDIIEYCRNFRPSAFGDEACREVERYCRAHGIWLDPAGQHYNSMTPYLHPGPVSAQRLTLIGLFNAILFWLNDTVGREKFGHLDSVGQHRAHTDLERLCGLLRTGTTPRDPSELEVATADFLSQVATLADPQWLREFMDSTVDHLQTAIRDQNARARGDLLSVGEYIDLRAQVSGMYPAIALCEFGRDRYLHRDRLRVAGLDTDVHRLRVLTAEIGALMNDMFSFEKECIVDRSDFNLIAVCLLNDPDATLADAVRAAGGIVRDRLTEFDSLRCELAARCADAGTRLARDVETHLADLTSCVQASWVWQLRTTRYKNTGIFSENVPLRVQDTTGVRKDGGCPASHTGVE